MHDPSALQVLFTEGSVGLSTLLISSFSGLFPLETLPECTQIRLPQDPLLVGSRDPAVFSMYFRIRDRLDVIVPSKSWDATDRNGQALIV